MRNYRGLVTAGLLVAVLFLPYWIYVPAIFAAIMIYPMFWEGMILSFLVDALYGSGIETWGSIFSTYAFWSLVILIIILPVRRRIRAYA